MITAVHTLIYSDDAPATRAFLRDVVRWPHVEDAGSEPGWLIFNTGAGELGVHPTSGGEGEGSYSTPRAHQIALMCDDVEATVAELGERGAEFSGEVSDGGFGLMVMMKLPGADDILLYQPKHQTAYDR